MSTKLKRYRWEVWAEDHDGSIHRLKRFATRHEAEDHPIIMANWKRAWVERSGKLSSLRLPWKVVEVNTFTYLHDADDNRLISLFGSAEQRSKCIEILIERGLVEEAKALDT